MVDKSYYDGGMTWIAMLGVLVWFERVKSRALMTWCKDWSCFNHLMLLEELLLY